MKTIHWGILGTGYAAQQFAEGLQTLADAKLLAVGSRKQETAETFAHQFQVPRTYQRYEDLVKDKDIDIVYIATPNPLHKAHSILCLEANKAVLCEKPFTLNADEARAVITLARQKQLFCMEAMWTRFIPLFEKLRDLLNAGTIGDLKMLTANFGLRVAFDEQDRHFNPQLGGGALLDLGIYPISLAFYLLGAPTTIVSQAHIGKTQVDEQSTLLFNYANGLLATLSSSFLTDLPNEMVIMGTQGRIQVHAPIYRPTQLSIQTFPALQTPTIQKVPNWKSMLKQNVLLRKIYRFLTQLTYKPKKISVPYAGNGYQYEAIEAMTCLRNGELESSTMPLDETLAILETLDTIRAQWR
jgi:predicted dehydrogenase